MIWRLYWLGLHTMKPVVYGLTWMAFKAADVKFWLSKKAVIERYK